MAWNRIGNLRGPIGPPGHEPGPIGPPGRDGESADPELVARAQRGHLIEEIERRVAALELPVGPVGPAGRDGRDGEPGAAGPIGPSGESGARGAQGFPGRDGLDGKDGAPGPQGNDADPELVARALHGRVAEEVERRVAALELPVGPAGPPGTNGRDGAPGERGLVGPIGQQGLQGPPGETVVGPKGADGIGIKGDPGPKGDAGDIGPIGPAGLRGEQGAPGKLPLVKAWREGEITYTAEVVTYKGSLYQATRDSAQAPGSSDAWQLVAAAGHDGADAPAWNIRGLYDASKTYRKFDCVASDGATFIARHDNPGVLPGDGWQLIARQGRTGRPGTPGELGPRGEKGDRGERGQDAPMIIDWVLDPVHYRAVPTLSNGKAGPVLELRGLFERFQEEVGGQ